jgi:4-hydroxy-3-methylbut-2-enyl diphosphate reductase
MLVERADGLNWSRVEGARIVGLTAGASAPEVLVDEVIARLSERYTLAIESITVSREDTVFSLPKALVG